MLPNELFVCVGQPVSLGGVSRIDSSRLMAEMKAELKVDGSREKSSTVSLPHAVSFVTKV